MLRWFLIAILAAGLTMAVIIAPSLISKPANTASDDLKFPTKTPELSGPAPKAAVDHPPIHQFDAMPQNAEGEHAWKITNAGQTDLELTKGPSTCSCTIANFTNDESKFVLKPGESTEIKLKWETRLNNGEFKKSASILTNDPLSPSIDFVVQGLVRPAVMVRPMEQVVNFGNVSNEKPNEQLVHTFSTDMPNFKITSVTNSRPEFIETTLEPFEKDNVPGLKETEKVKGFIVTVRLKKGMPVGLFSEEMVIKTDHPKQGDIKVALSGKMSGPISSFPEILRLSQISSEKGANAQTMLIVRDKRPTKFEVVRKPDLVKVEIKPADEKSAGDAAGRYLMTVTIPAGTKPGTIEGDVLIKTDHPMASEVKVPVTGVILGSK
jgi:hypothetical protein